jgi:hypothetical protein
LAKIADLRELLSSPNKNEGTLKTELMLLERAYEDFFKGHR